MKYKIHGATLASLKMKTIEGGVDVVVAAMPGCNGMAESIGWVRVVLCCAYIVLEAWCGLKVFATDPGGGECTWPSLLDCQSDLPIS